MEADHCRLKSQRMLAFPLSEQGASEGLLNDLVTGIIRRDSKTFSVTSVGDWLMRPPRSYIPLVSAVFCICPGQYTYNQK